jgi:Polyketide cyclase / dehydrase and lipid transport
MKRSYAIASAERVSSSPLAITYELVGSIDPTVFYTRYGPLPAVMEVREQQGDWNVVGSTRLLLLSDWGSVRETVTDADSPRFFAYDSQDFKKIFGRIVSGSRAEWTFTEVDGGTRIHWNYSFHPRPKYGPIVRAIVRTLWAPYMRTVLKKIVREVELEVSRGAATPSS